MEQPKIKKIKVVDSEYFFVYFYFGQLVSVFVHRINKVIALDGPSTFTTAIDATTIILEKLY